MADEVDLLQIKIEKAKRELPVDTLNAINAVDWRTAVYNLRNKKGFTFEQLGDLEIETELVLCGLLNPKDYPKEVARQMRISQARADDVVNEMNMEVFEKIRQELVKNTERKKIFAGKIVKSSVIEKNSPLEEYSDFSRREVDNPPRPLSTKSTPQEGNSPSHSLQWSGAGKEKTEEILPEPEKLELQNSPLEEYSDLGRREVEKFPPLLHKERARVRSIHPGASATPEEGNKISSILTQKLSGSVKIPTIKTDHSLNNITPSPGGAEIKKVTVDPYREIPE